MSYPNRRTFLKLSGFAAAGTCLGTVPWLTSPGADLLPPTHVLRIRRSRVELSPGHWITTRSYDGSLPGPLLRARVGQPVRVDIHNGTDSPEFVSWQGQILERQPPGGIAAGTVGRMEFTPKRPGLYLYQSGVMAAANLEAGAYSGQSGALLVEPADAAGSLPMSRLLLPAPVLVLKEYGAFLRRTQRGHDVGYETVTLNGRLPGAAPAFRADADGAALLHVLNASATQPRRLELPGHEFEVVALDGFAVPVARRVGALVLSPGERVTAVARTHLNSSRHISLTEDADDEPLPYTYFGVDSRRSAAADEVIPLTIQRHEAARSGFNRWSVNGVSYGGDATPALLRVVRGSRYRLQVMNLSDDIIPLTLEGHRLEVVRVGTVNTGGVFKDVVAVGAQQRVEVEFVADSPCSGSAMLSCTRQLHRDFGLMARVEYVDCRKMRTAGKSDKFPSVAV